MTDQARRYLIWSNYHGGWWKISRNGYTALLTEAGRFSLTEASRIVERSNIAQAPGAGPNAVLLLAPGPGPEVTAADAMPLLELAGRAVQDSLGAWCPLDDWPVLLSHVVDPDRNTQAAALRQLAELAVAAADTLNARNGATA